MIDFSAIYEKIGYTFRDENLLLRALTHSSYDRDASYERLEFLGDSIVGYAVSDILYFSSGKDEGTMTRTRASMVSKEPLAYLADLLGFSANCRKRNCALSVKMKCDLYEAVTAAISLDGGFPAAVDFVKRTITLAPQASEDYKSRLKEYCEKQKLSYHAPYTSSGRADKSTFTVEVYVGGKSLGVGKGPSVLRAENEACRAALIALGVISL